MAAAMAADAGTSDGRHGPYRRLHGQAGRRTGRRACRQRTHGLRKARDRHGTAAPDQFREDAGRGRRAKPRGRARPPRFNLPFLVVVALLGGLRRFWWCGRPSSSDPDYRFSRQLAGVAVGAVCHAFALAAGLPAPGRLCGSCFLVVNVVLILSPHIPGPGRRRRHGRPCRGSRWASQVQPGEFAKVTVVLYAASLVARYGGQLDQCTRIPEGAGRLAASRFCAS